MKTFKQLLFTHLISSVILTLISSIWEIISVNETVYVIPYTFVFTLLSPILIGFLILYHLITVYLEKKRMLNFLSKLSVGLILETIFYILIFLLPNINVYSLSEFGQYFLICSAVALLIVFIYVSVAVFLNRGQKE